MRWLPSTSFAFGPPFPQFGGIASGCFSSVAQRVVRIGSVPFVRLERERRSSRRRPRARRRPARSTARNGPECLCKRETRRAKARMRGRDLVVGSLRSTSGAWRRRRSRLGRARARARALVPQRGDVCLRSPKGIDEMLGRMNCDGAQRRALSPEPHSERRHRAAERTFGGTSKGRRARSAQVGVEKRRRPFGAKPARPAAFGRYFRTRAENARSGRPPARPGDRSRKSASGGGSKRDTSCYERHPVVAKLAASRWIATQFRVRKGGRQAAAPEQSRLEVLGRRDPWPLRG